MCSTANKYKYKLGTWLAIISAISLFFSCKEKKAARDTERSFYYWKSAFRLNETEQQCIKSLDIKTIYIKYFDVGWDEMAKLPVPIAKLQNTSYKLQKNINVIPTVFITNECIQKIDSSQIQQLAESINKLTQDITNTNGFNGIAEIQIDCDWTASTKDRYFQLLKVIKKLWGNIPISATIRLHQVKYFSKTGMPPVDKGLLMCYNMGNLKNPLTNNSILETAELKKYIGNISSYSLPLDVAFPLFDWKVLFRNNQYAGLIENLPDTLLTLSFTTVKQNRYTILKDTLLQGYHLQKGDVLRNEQSDYKEILSAAAEINKRLKNNRPRVALYHLDAVILKKYTLHELETIYNSLR